MSSDYYPKKPRLSSSAINDGSQDSLTQLPSRKIFIDRLEQAMIQANRKKELATILCLDVDHFNRVNASFGYKEGDRVLLQVAARIQENLYETDSVARMGADNFMILCPRISSPRMVEVIANKILTSFKIPFEIKGQKVFIQPSIGIAIFPFDGHKAADLMQNADQVMRISKDKGGGQYHFYSSNLAKDTLEELYIESQLRNAIARKQLRLYYQPQIDCLTNTMTGVEALLRWEHPEMGMVGPNQFIPIAEKTGLIHPIGEWVLENACMQKKLWEQRGVGPLRMAVNLSARQFHHVNIVHLIEGVLKRTGLDPHSLELELTESMIMKYGDETIKTLQDLKAMGCLLSIDDFGTGYSSLVALKHFPIDTIKIDRSFIQDLEQDSDDKAITQAIISLAKDLKLDVIAEGVETDFQIDFLRSKNCHKMQGFYFSQPVPSHKVEGLFPKFHSPRAA